VAVDASGDWGQWRPTGGQGSGGLTTCLSLRCTGLAAEDERPMMARGRLRMSGRRLRTSRRDTLARRVGGRCGEAGWAPRAGAASSRASGDSRVADVACPTVGRPGRPTQWGRATVGRSGRLTRWARRRLCGAAPALTRGGWRGVAARDGGWDGGTGKTVTHR
jgi:hypothetical protein